MALAPVVTALIEPAITGARFERHNLLLGILVIPGRGAGGRRHPAATCIWGSGWASSPRRWPRVFNALNKRYLGHHDAMAVTWLELGAGFLLVAADRAHSWPRMARALSCPMSGRGMAAGAGHPLHPDPLRGVARHAAASVGVHRAAGDQPGAAFTPSCIAVLFLGEARELDTAVLPGRGHRAGRGFRPRMAANRGLTDERRSV